MKAAPRRKTQAPPRASIEIKRAYDPPARGDGLRILVDRLWPRGVSKAALQLDAWMKDVAPSNELRRWYAHDPDRATEFRRRYRAELKKHKAELDELRDTVKGRTVTFVTATRDVELSHAIVLRDVLQDKTD
jgi:uncharacterized protein YeaO (DUF488 family)